MGRTASRKMNDLVKTGVRIYRLTPGMVEPAVNGDVRIIYEDEAILVLEKPAPLPMHPCGRFTPQYAAVYSQCGIGAAATTPGSSPRCQYDWPGGLCSDAAFRGVAATAVCGGSGSENSSGRGAGTSGGGTFCL